MAMEALGRPSGQWQWAHERLTTPVATPTRMQEDGKWATGDENFASNFYSLRRWRVASCRPPAPSRPLPTCGASRLTG
eukprot:scaffold69174_cov28-Tisochrysis_lutea.AAC.5